MIHSAQLQNTQSDLPVRDLTGYGRTPPALRWPNGSGLALNFVLNVEEGAEYTTTYGDPRSEAALTEVRASRVPLGERDLAAESMYEYGSRVGFWRIYDLFRQRDLPLTIFASAAALELNPEITAALTETDWDVCAHGNRWVEHFRMDEATERGEIDQAFSTIEKLLGRPPMGWYCRYAPSVNTRRLIVAHGGFDYDSDAYNDDIPYWTRSGGKAHLVVPYSLTTNDAKFLSGDVFNARHFAEFLSDSFDVLQSESDQKTRLMSVGLHSRIIGHPGRFAHLRQFMDHVDQAPAAWICRRADIAKHWKAVSQVSAGAPS